ncbi:MAG: insulinase family protein [Bacteroidetes bacterium]|nr:insulinase family protein [Bacteroidota bacterium]
MKNLILFTFILTSGLSLRAQSALSPASPLPLDPAVRTGKLPNGLTYYIRRNTEPKQRVVLYLVNKIGSLMETEEQRGLAHFMEHMSFNGTKNFPGSALIDYLQKSGVRFGADINAYTSFDETVYQLPIPSDKPGLLHNGMRILRDWAQNATLDAAEIDKERGVVLEEKRLGKGAAERMSRQYWPLLLNHSRYAERIPIGLDTVLEHSNPSQIRRFYHDWYRPDLQAVIVVGDIDPGQMEREIRTLFSDLKNPANEPKRIHYTVPLTGRNQFVAVTDKETGATEVKVIIKHPGLPNKTAADHRDHMVRQLFNQMLQQRYTQLVRQPDPPFLNASAGINGFLGDLDAYEAGVTAAPGRLEEGFKAMWRENVRIRKFGFTADELSRVKTNYRSSIESFYKERDKIPSVSYANEYQDYFLKGNAAAGADVEYDLVKNELPGITLSEINALPARYILTKDRDILLLAPDKDRSDLPDSARLAQWMAAVETEPLQPYHEESSRLPLLDKTPVGGATTASLFDNALNLTTLTLGNGVKVLLKPTSFRNDEVLFSAFAPGGTSLYSDQDFQSAANASGIIGAGGVGNYNITELQHFLTGKQVGVQPFIGERSQGISGSARTGDLETALQLVYACFTAPRKDTAMFRSILQRSRASLAGRDNIPGSVFQDSVSAILSSYNPRRTGPSLAKLDQLDLDKAYRIYKERFSDASGFTFTFVGNFDTAAIRPLLEKYLGSLPATHEHQSARDLGIEIPHGVIERTIYKGSEPKATVQLFFSGDLEYTQDHILRLEALKEALQIRLIQRLREQESGVYSPQVQVNAAQFPHPIYAFVISFGCAPANADKLVASALDEIAKLRTDGPLPENVGKWKAEDKTGRETQLHSNRWWLGYLTRQLENGEDLHQFETYDSARDRITVEDLKTAANKYLDGKNYIRLQLMPEIK